MPKEEKIRSAKFKRLISEYGDIFCRNEDKLFCKLCKISVSVNRVYNVRRHVNRDVHKRALMKLKEEGGKCEEGHSSSSVFHEEMWKKVTQVDDEIGKIISAKVTNMLEKWWIL